MPAPPARPTRHLARGIVPLQPASRLYRQVPPRALVRVYARIAVHACRPYPRVQRHVLEAKIKATIRNEGGMIGWESDEETVGPRALAAKESLLRAIPYLLPPDAPEASLYRLVLEHGDFGIYNTTITKQESGEPLLTSLFDWETACI